MQGYNIPYSYLGININSDSKTTKRRKTKVNQYFKLDFSDKTFDEHDINHKKKGKLQKINISREMTEKINLKTSNAPHPHNPLKMNQKNNKEKRKQPKNLKIITFNCRGLASKKRMYEFEQTCNKINYDIIGLSEIRKNGEKFWVNTEGNYCHYFEQTTGYRGTGFYIHKSTSSRILEVKGITERISILKIEVDRGTTLMIAQVYAPTMAADEKEIENFCTNVQQTLLKEREYYNLITGGWNAKIGQNWDNNSCMGQFGLGKRNQNGERPIEFAQRNKLKIANAFINKKDKKKWT